MLAGILPHHAHFYPRSPCGERPYRDEISENQYRHFYPRSPCGERRQAGTHAQQPKQISIHALLAESDDHRAYRQCQINYFYPRSPCGERQRRQRHERGNQHISIHALLAESDIDNVHSLQYDIISIHALLAESDCFSAPYRFKVAISIHALLAESDMAYSRLFTRIAYFYPRSPCGERRETTSIKPILSDFYPRSPCGERQLYINRTAKAVIFLSTLSLRRATVLGIQHRVGEYISIHALLAESDFMTLMQKFCVLIFLSTLSLRRATAQKNSECRFLPISIHALLAESDCYSFRHSASCWHFYPRSPCGERQSPQSWQKPHGQFLSTLSLRRATASNRPERQKQHISIHALLAESDC